MKLFGTSRQTDRKRNTCSKWRLPCIQNCCTLKLRPIHVQNYSYCRTKKQQVQNKTAHTIFWGTELACHLLADVACLTRCLLAWYKLGGGEARHWIMGVSRTDDGLVMHSPFKLGQNDSFVLDNVYFAKSGRRVYRCSWGCTCGSFVFCGSHNMNTWQPLFWMRVSITFEHMAVLLSVVAFSLNACFSLFCICPYMPHSYQINSHRNSCSIPAVQ